ncbi:MAG: DUF3365 domain-containing protein [Bdellovibrionaceae bacterium]|nr:DUF3365 domain-containing protein [Pseudobdellovibrionaceae bacterium]
MFEKLNSKILLIVVFSCLICLSIAVGVARHFNQKELHSGIVDKSRAIHSRLRAATAFVANQGGLKPIIDSMTAKYKSSTEMTDEDKRAVLAQVPVFAAMKIGAEGAEQEHYSFRVFSDEPRRKENKATLAELEIFKKFEADPELLEWVSDDAKVVTVFRPIRISEKQGCLNCHGNPSMSPWGNGEDVLGYKMENWRDGKLHGVFALITNIDDVKAAKAKIELMSTDKQIGLFIGVGLILALVIAAVLVRGPLSRVKSVSEKLVSDSNDVGSAVSQIFSIS